MKYIKQFGLILLVSFVGEVLHELLPLPVPASIYGIVLLFLCLERKLIPLEAVKDASRFLIEIMPLMFVPAAVGLLESWGVVAPNWISYIGVTVVTTVAVMAVSGRVTQAVIRRRKKMAEREAQTKDE